MQKIKTKDFTYVLPEEISLEQYTAISEMLTKLDLSLDSGDITDAWQIITALFMKFMQQGVIGQALAILLVRVDENDVCEEWEPEFADLRKNDFKKVGDKSIASVLQDFLSGRKDLITTLINSFKKLMNE
jgi:hypothetical protein